MDEVKRETLRWFPDINGTQVCEGDRIAVAVGEGRHGGGLRIGHVAPDGITAVFLNGAWQRFRVKVAIVTTSGYSFGGLPYVKTYEDPSRMVKLDDRD
jgi:hypothetical protein